MRSVDWSHHDHLLYANLIEDTTNVFPGECPRHLLRSDRDILHTPSMYRCNDLTCRLHCIFSCFLACLFAS